MRAFLYRVLRNKVTDYYRKRKTESLDSFLEKGGDVPDTHSFIEMQNSTEVSHLFSLLKKIDIKYQEPVLLRFVEGLGIKEVAEIVGETENNTSVLIYRGIQKLKELAHI